MEYLTLFLSKVYYFVKCYVIEIGIPLSLSQ